MIIVLFICHGNICRSTMAESIMTYLVKQARVEDQFYINSAATSCEEIGNPPHHGTVNKLRQEGIPVLKHRAIQMTKQEYEEMYAMIDLESSGYISKEDFLKRNSTINEGIEMQNMSIKNVE